MGKRGSCQDIIICIYYTILSCGRMGWKALGYQRDEGKGIGTEGESKRLDENVQVLSISVEGHTVVLLAMVWLLVRRAAHEWRNWQTHWI